MSELLQIKNLKKHFPTKNGLLHAVDDVTFSIEKGKTIGIVGESGCGKSTLGRTILKLHEPTSGQIVYEGVDIANYNARQMREVRKKMQIIFQDPYSSINPRMSVGQLIAEPLKINKMCESKEEMNKKVLKYMDIAGLSRRLQNAYPHELDGGRRQRIGIARALIMEPEFVICDEPVSALDVSIQAQILNLLQDLQEEMNLTYIFITHDLSVVKHISDEIVVMYLGKIVEKAAPDVLFENPKHPYTKALLSAIPVPSLDGRNSEFEIIRGEVTSPINPKAACRFVNRCDFCSDQCRNAEPELLGVNGEHFVACFNQ